jgi:hypothetical protein
MQIDAHINVVDLYAPINVVDVGAQLNAAAEQNLLCVESELTKIHLMNEDKYLVKMKIN